MKPVPHNTMPRTAAPLALAALLALLAGCQRTGESASYFPLEAGQRWVYATQTEWENHQVERDTLTLTSQGRESIDGGAAWHRRSESGVDYWLRSDETGIYRVASKSDLDAEPKSDQPPRYVLREPLAVGTQWQAATTAYLLHRRQDFPREIRHSHPVIPMTYTIAALDQTVGVPAGTFQRCIHVRGAGAVRLYADPVSGWRDLPLTTDEWYCPGVGLVKLRREEPASSAFLAGGTYTMELKQWP